MLCFVCICVCVLLVVIVAKNMYAFICKVQCNDKGWMTMMVEVMMIIVVVGIRSSYWCCFVCLLLGIRLWGCLMMSWLESEVDSS